MEFVQEESRGSSGAPGHGRGGVPARTVPCFSHGPPSGCTCLATWAPGGRRSKALGPARFHAMIWVWCIMERGYSDSEQSRSRALTGSHCADLSYPSCSTSLALTRFWLLGGMINFENPDPAHPWQKIDLGWLFKEHLLSSNFLRPSMELWGRYNVVWCKYGFCTL